MRPAPRRSFSTYCQKTTRQLEAIRQSRAAPEPGIPTSKDGFGKRDVLRGEGLGRYSSWVARQSLNYLRITQLKPRCRAPLSLRGRGVRGEVQLIGIATDVTQLGNAQ